MSGMEVHKVEYVIPAPHPEVLADAAGIWQAYERFMHATPEQRAEWAAEQKRQREAERNATDHRPLTLDALLEKQGWTREYAEHLVQSYCDCEAGREGWDYCSHAYDEGFVGGRRG